MRKPSNYYKHNIQALSLDEKKQLFKLFLSQKVFAMPISLEKAIKKEDYVYFRTLTLSAKFKKDRV